MDSWLRSSPHDLHRIYLSLILLILVFVEIPQSLCDDDFYSTCKSIFNCGNIRNVDFPFWGGNRPRGCGYPGLKLNCERSVGVATIEIMNVNYRVLDVDSNTQILKISREDYRDGLCSPVYVNSTLDFTLFDFGPGYQNLTLYYGCRHIFQFIPWRISCDVMNRGDVYLELGAHGPKDSCNASVVVPIPRSIEIGNLSKLLVETIRDGIDIRWKVNSDGCKDCKESMGVCGYDLNSNRTTCYHSPSPGSSNVDQLVIGIPIGVVGIVVLCLVIVYSVKRGHLSSNSTAWWKRSAKDYHFKAEEIIANFGSMAPKRYTYSDVKKLTKSFKDKVGQGGFGVVYKGKLPDGRIVAVKVLSNSKDNGEEFINEVASISRTSHVNIVSLLGFCYERSKRALIYEFVPNGSLDSFIYNKRTLDNIANCHLENRTMFQIVVGIARGLEYLHSGCRTRILHFDIKPHNILLDEKFCPKISDFGLAKLCKTRDQSVVSMTGTRGTIGYIAPEVFSRTFGGVSHKSDVYSYGMLVLEMVGGRKDVESGISCTSEKYFPHGIYEKLEHDETLVNFDVTRDEEDIIKKMIIISLWCIQTNPSDRPSIGKVIEMLEGSTLQSLQLPPKPFLNSPPRPVPVLDSSTTSLLSMEG